MTDAHEELEIIHDLRKDVREVTRDRDFWKAAFGRVVTAIVQLDDSPFSHGRLCEIAGCTIQESRDSGVLGRDADD